MQIFLDLDGVMRSWDEGVFKWYDVEPIEIRHWDEGVNYIKEKINISNSEFWEGLTDKFWSTLPKTKYFDEILKILSPITPKPIVLTSPSWSGSTGTQMWIREHLPDYFYNKRYLIGPAKYGCASSDSLLIDDSGRNCKMFEEHGGYSILFPQLYNSLSHFTGNPVKYLADNLDYYLNYHSQ